MNVKEFEKLARRLNELQSYSVYSIGKMVRLEDVLSSMALEVVDAKVDVSKDEAGNLSVNFKLNEIS